MEGDGLRAEGEFLAFIWLVSITTGDSCVRHSSGRFGLLDLIFVDYLTVYQRKWRSGFNLNVPPSSLSPW